MASLLGVVLLLIMAFAMCVAAAPASSPATQQQPSLLKDLTTAAPPPSNEPLREWLYGLVIPFPNISVPVPLIKTFNLTDLTCTHLSLGEIQSEADTQHSTYRASLKGLSIECTGRYAVHTPKLSGPLQLDLIPKSEIGLGIQFLPGHDSLADAANATELDINVATAIAIPDAPKFINNIIDDIDDALTPVVNKQLKQVLRGLINTNLTRVLHSVNDVIRPHLHPPTHFPQPPVPPGPCTPFLSFPLLLKHFPSLSLSFAWSSV